MGSGAARSKSRTACSTACSAAVDGVLDGVLAGVGGPLEPACAELASAEERWTNSHAAAATTTAASTATGASQDGDPPRGAAAPARGAGCTPGGGTGAATVGRGTAVSRTVGAGPPTAARISAAVARAAGCFTRARRKGGSSQAGTPAMSGSSVRSRCTSTPIGPSPKGSRPVAAHSNADPHPHTSTAAVTGPPFICSGAIHPGDPTTKPAWVSAVRSCVRAMPRSTSTGPWWVRMTFAGFTSRWTIPCAWSAASASARPAASNRSAASGSGLAASCSVGPCT